MENSKLFNLLLACLEDVIEDLEELVVSNGDFCLDEIASLKQHVEAIKKSQRKVGGQN